MPTLVLSVPCEKPILGADNSLSLINVMHAITVNVVTNDNLDETAIGLGEWHNVTIWRREPGDENKRFQQRMIITDPTGKARYQSLAEFEMTKPFHRHVTKVTGLPLVPEGGYTIHVSIHELDFDQWTECGAYPLEITVRRTKPTSELSASTPQTH